MSALLQCSISEHVIWNGPFEEHCKLRRFPKTNRSEGFPNRIFDPCTLWARGLARWKNCRRAVAVAVAVGVIFPGTGSQNVFFRQCCTKKGTWKHIIFPGTGSQNVFFRKCCTKQGALRSNNRNSLIDYRHWVPIIGILIPSTMLNWASFH